MEPPVRLARTAGLLYLAGGGLRRLRPRRAHPGLRARRRRSHDGQRHRARDARPAELRERPGVGDVHGVPGAGAAPAALLRQPPRRRAPCSRWSSPSSGSSASTWFSQLGALLVATESSYAATFGAETVEGLVLLLMELQHHGYLIAQIFFGLWLWPLGRLVLLSGRFPRILGAPAHGGRGGLPRRRGGAVPRVRRSGHRGVVRHRADRPGRRAVDARLPVGQGDPPAAGPRSPADAHADPPARA